MEFTTLAIVLDREPIGEYDELIHLFSRTEGRIIARAVSSRKKNSKLASHLNPLSLAHVRLVGAGPFVVADALLQNRFTELWKERKEIEKALRLCSFVKSFFPHGSRDAHAWDILVESFDRGAPDFLRFLSAVGFDALHASCALCSKTPVTSFHIGNQSFFCARCSSKNQAHELLYID